MDIPGGLPTYYLQNLGWSNLRRLARYDALHRLLLRRLFTVSYILNNDSVPKSTLKNYANFNPISPSLHKTHAKIINSNSHSSPHNNNSETTTRTWTTLKYSNPTKEEENRSKPFTNNPPKYSVKPAKTNKNPNVSNKWSEGDQADQEK